MASDVTKLRVFIAAPGDVARERAEAFRILNQINAVAEPHVGVSLDALRWETLPPTIPEESIQDHINKLAAKCDIFVIILYRRYGSVVPGQTKSNTERELEYALNQVRMGRNIYLLTYFRESGIEIDPGPQQLKVKGLKRYLEQNRVSYKTYKTADDFRDSITADLYAVIFRFLAGRSPRQPSVGTAEQLPQQVQKREPTPVVFISYSHDSDDHIRWVVILATDLIQSGVDVLLDQWDLHAGDDVAGFMERGVAESNRVLVVCTPRYVSRSDHPKGGVGYEKTIITGEIVWDIGTNKFIPLLRRSEGDRHLPRCLSSRLFIDFRDDARYEQNVEALLREIHEHPAFPKPALGKSPFE